jgi:hypothetical protein
VLAHAVQPGAGNRRRIITRQKEPDEVGEVAGRSAVAEVMGAEGL